MVLTLWPPSVPFGNRAANYQSWEHRSTDLSGHRRRVDRLAARNRRTRVATGHFTDSFSLPLPRCTLPSFRRLSARQPVQKALFHSPSNGVLDSLHFVSCLPAAPVLFYQRFHSLSPPFSKSGGDGVATVSCWQLFRVLKRAAKKFWLCRLPLTLVMPVVLAADYTDLRRFVETEIVREKKKKKEKYAQWRAGSCVNFGRRSTTKSAGFLDKSYAVWERGCGGAPYFRVKRRTMGAGGEGEGNKWDQLRRVFAPSTSERRAEPLSGLKRAKIHLLPTKHSSSEIYRVAEHCCP